VPRATVALLAIPGINGMTQIAGLMSALCALGSVLVGTLLVSNHQSRIESSSSAVVSLVEFLQATYISSIEHPIKQFLYFKRAKKHGMGTARPLAVILSLPVSLMLWGMFWFIFAIASCAYASGLPGISSQYAISTRVILLSFVFALLVLGAVVVSFFYKIWGQPELESRKTEPTGVSKSERNQSPTRKVDGPSDGADNDQAREGRHLPYPPVPPPPVPPPPFPLPPFGPLPTWLQPVYPPRRPTVEFDETATPFIPPPNFGNRTESSTDYETSRPRPYYYDAGRPRVRDRQPSIITSSTFTSSEHTNQSTGTPIIQSFPYQGSPSNGLFIDIDLRQAIPTTSTVPPKLHALQRGFQVTLILPTGQTALLLTALPPETWTSLVRGESSYAALVSDIRSVCAQYGVIESLSVPRRMTSQNGDEAVGQAFVKFRRPECASAALRGFMDQTLESCPVSARLLSNTEEVAWRTSQQAWNPVLPTLTEEASMYQDAAQGSTQGNEIITKTLAGTSDPASRAESISQLNPALVAGPGTFTDQPVAPSKVSPDSTSNAGHHVLDVMN
jgi:hypothetical protein